MTINVTKSAKITKSSMTLQDFRELVEACKDFGMGARVSINVSPGDYNQGNYYTITVTEV